MLSLSNFVIVFLVHVWYLSEGWESYKRYFNGKMGAWFTAFSWLYAAWGIANGVYAFRHGLNIPMKDIFEAMVFACIGLIMFWALAAISRNRSKHLADALTHLTEQQQKLIDLQRERMKNMESTQASLVKIMKTHGIEIDLFQVKDGDKMYSIKVNDIIKHKKEN